MRARATRLMRKREPRGLPDHVFPPDFGAPEISASPRERAGFQDKVPGLRDKPAAPVRTGEDGLRAWRARPELDAWITFESWHRAASAETDFVPLPGGIGAARPAVIAVTRWTPRRMLALEFISFLRGPHAYEVLGARGWR